MPKESLPDEPQYSCRMRYPFPPFIRRNSLILNGFKCMSGLPFLRNNSGSPERGAGKGVFWVEVRPRVLRLVC
jgi:hypothetical protein